MTTERPVFIHISKNAGTSLVRAAGGNIVNAGHRTAAAWVAEHGDEPPMFCVVRHPYDRVLSEYSYRRRRWLGGETNPHLGNLALPFDEWVVATYVGDQFRTRAFFDRTGTPFNERRMTNDVLVWFIPQVAWISDSDGGVLVDDILRFEHLSNDWHRFTTKYGFDAPLPHANASPADAESVERFTDDVREVIADYFRDDFANFGYSP